MINASVTPLTNPHNSTLYEVRHQIERALEHYSACADQINILGQSYTFLNNSSNNLDRFVEAKTHIVGALRRFFGYYERWQELVLTELKNWRRQQTLADNGASLNIIMLDDIQSCFKLLEKFVTLLQAGVIQIIWMQLMSGEDMELKALLEQVQWAQKNLICSAFIVDKQPPQVMKTNPYFQTSVRWLLGSQLVIHEKPLKVECIIISELQAQSLVSQPMLTYESLAGESSGTLLYNSSYMMYQPNSHVISAKFNMKLKNIKRADRRGSESVMDEKFALLFYATIMVNNYEIQAWTLSLPVVVIVNVSQEPQSWATITWDNAFADIVRNPFMVTDRVTWCQLLIALNMKFGSSTQRSLTTENLDFLKEKLLCDNEYISWNQFCKEPLPDRTFTFWDWFFAIMKLTKDHLLNMWKAGRITGFINKAKAQDDLMSAGTGIGTFLLRFSDSELGGVSIAFVNKYRSVTNIMPWFAKDLNTINLADRINNLAQLRWLHPSDINMLPLERDAAFGEYYSQPPIARTGYELSLVAVLIRSRLNHSENMTLEETLEYLGISSPMNP